MSFLENKEDVVGEYYDLLIAMALALVVGPVIGLYAYWRILKGLNGFGEDPMVNTRYARVRR